MLYKYDEELAEIEPMTSHNGRQAAAGSLLIFAQ
jgi:hypothetical protein